MEKRRGHKDRQEQGSHHDLSSPLTGWPPEWAKMCIASSPRGCRGPHTALEPVCGVDGSSQPVKGRRGSRQPRTCASQEPPQTILPLPA